MKRLDQPSRKASLDHDEDGESHLFFKGTRDIPTPRTMRSQSSMDFMREESIDHLQSKSRTTTSAKLNSEVIRSERAPSSSPDSFRIHQQLNDKPQPSKALFGKRLNIDECPSEASSTSLSTDMPWASLNDHEYITQTSRQEKVKGLVYYIAFALRRPLESGVIKSWLRKDSRTIFAILDDTEPDGWSRFCSHVEKARCVALFDSQSPFYKASKISKYIAWPSLVYWTVTREVDSDGLHLHKLFSGTGGALLLTERSFIEDLGCCIFVVKWVKYIQLKVRWRLCLPWGIQARLLERAGTESGPKRQLLLHAAMLIENLQVSGCVSFLKVNIGRCVDSGTKSSLQQYELEVLSYYASWALSHINDFRRFVALATNERPDNAEHIDFRTTRNFMEKEKSQFDKLSLDPKSEDLIEKQKSTKSS